MPAVTNLGHLGLFCQDVEKMRDFYSRFMGMTITDEDPEWGICFLSANPEQEHHELALARMRPNGETTQYLQQVSFIVDSMAVEDSSPASGRGFEDRPDSHPRNLL